MYIEISEKKYNLFKKILDKKDISYEHFAYPINQDSKQYHFEFGEINEDTIAKIYEIYVAVSDMVHEPVNVSRHYNNYYTPVEEMVKQIKDELGLESDLEII